MLGLYTFSPSAILIHSERERQAPLPKSAGPMHRDIRGTRCHVHPVIQELPYEVLAWAVTRSEVEMSPKSGNSKIKRQAKEAAKNGEKHTKSLRRIQPNDSQVSDLARAIENAFDEPVGDPFDSQFEIRRSDGRVEFYSMDDGSIFVQTMKLSTGARFFFAYVSGKGFTLTDPETKESFRFNGVDYWTDRTDENAVPIDGDDGIGAGDPAALHDFYTKMNGDLLRKSFTGDESDREYFELIASALIERSREVGSGSVKITDNTEYPSIATDGDTEYELMFVLVSDDIRDDVQSAFEVAVNDEFGVGLNAQVSQESDGIRLIIPVAPGTGVDEDTLDGILQNVIQDVAPEGDIVVENRPEVLSVMVGEGWSEE